MNRQLISLAFLFLSSTIVLAQIKRSEGPIIKEFGPTFVVENPDIKTDTDSIFKVIFDVSQAAEDRSTINKYIETAARFYNMHANAGMAHQQLKVAMTIHASAWQDVLTDEAYMNKYGVANPNTALIDALVEAGADVIICGQTASFREMSKQDINPNVKLALSAMTALIQYQDKGYRFIKF